MLWGLLKALTPALSSLDGTWSAKLASFPCCMPGTCPSSASTERTKGSVCCRENPGLHSTLGSGQGGATGISVSEYRVEPKQCTDETSSLLTSVLLLWDEEVVRAPGPYNPLCTPIPIAKFYHSCLPQITSFSSTHILSTRSPGLLGPHIYPHMTLHSPS